MGEEDSNLNVELNNTSVAPGVSFATNCALGLAACRFPKAAHFRQGCQRGNHPHNIRNLTINNTNRVLFFTM